MFCLMQVINVALICIGSYFCNILEALNAKNRNNTLHDT